MLTKDKNFYETQLKEIETKNLVKYSLSDRYCVKTSEFMKIIEFDLSKAFKTILVNFFPDIFEKIRECYENTKIFHNKQKQHECAFKALKYKIFKDKEKEFNKFINEIEKKYKELLFEYINDKYEPAVLFEFVRDGAIVGIYSKKSEHSKLERKLKGFKVKEKPVYKLIRTGSDLFIYYSPEEIVIKGNLKYISQYILNIINLKTPLDDYFDKARTIKRYIESMKDVLTTSELAEPIQKLIGGFEFGKIYNPNKKRFIDVNNISKQDLINYNFQRVYEQVILPVLSLNYGCV